MADSPSTPNPDEFWLDRRAHRSKSHFRRRASQKEWAREQLMREWYGEALAPQEIIEHRAPIQRLGDAVSAVIKELQPRGADLLDTVQGQWPQIVGDDVAQHCRPASIVAQTLRIEVYDSTWYYILANMSRNDIVQRVRTASNNQIRSVQFAPGARRSDGL